MAVWGDDVSVDEAALVRALPPMLQLLGPSSGPTQQELLARMQEVVEAAVTVLRVDSVGLILLDEDDRPRVAAATNESAWDLEQAQAEYGEGPGIDSLRTGEPVAVDDLSEADDYPRLREHLAGTEVRAVLSSPIRVNQSIVGNFNSIVHEAHDWTMAQRRANGAYADVVGLALRVSAAAAKADETVERLRGQSALSGDTQRWEKSVERGASGAECEPSPPRRTGTPHDR